MDEPLSVELNDVELWLLASLQGPGLVLGVPDPHLGRLRDEVEAANRAAIQSLSERGLVLPLSGGEVSLEAGLARMVETVHHPKHSLIACEQRDRRVREAMVLFANGTTVEHVRLGGGRHRLSLLKNTAEVVRRLLCEPGSTPPFESGARSFRLPEQILLAARRQAEAGHEVEAVSTLTRTGILHPDACALASALRHPISKASYALVANQREGLMQHVRGFSVLEGSDETWILVPVEQSGEPYVEVVTADSGTVRRRLQELLP